MEAARRKAPVSERALVARINRLLAKREETLRRCRQDSRWFQELGKYYVVEFRRNSVLYDHVDIAKLAEDLNVLAPYEALTDQYGLFLDKGPTTKKEDATISRRGFETDKQLLDAIQALTGGNLDCNGSCGNPKCDGMHLENCDDPAVALWRDGGHEEALRAWLDENRPGWRDDAPLAWGAGKFE